jgi:hypothetical protein
VMFFQNVKMTYEVFTAKIFFWWWSHFPSVQHVNWPNVRIWWSSNLHSVIEVPRSVPLVLCSTKKCSDTSFLPDALWLVMYLDILQGFLMLMMCWRKMVLVSCYSSKTELPPLYSHAAAQDFLDQKFPSNWNGKGDPVAWSPCFPDLTSLDFFLWGYRKDAVYISPFPSTLQELGGEDMRCCRYSYTHHSFKYVDWTWIQIQWNSLKTSPVKMFSHLRRQEKKKHQNSPVWLTLDVAILIRPCIRKFLA